MKLIVIVALALSSACGVTQGPPVQDRAPSGVSEIAPPALAQRAVEVELALMSVAADAPAPEVTVHWTADIMPYDTVGAVGLFYGCDAIWVRVSTNPLAGPIPLTLAHELGHCMREIATGDSDHDHTDSAWFGDTGIVEAAHQAMIKLVVN